jgi:hypothetical protein
VAAARDLGQVEIDAEVTEFIPLGDAVAQRAFAERRTFERSTGLTRVEAASAESYQALQHLVDEFLADAGPIDRREGARRWYTQVFRPSVRRIRQLGLARHFAGERSADIVARIGRYRNDHHEPAGDWIPWDTAVEAFARETRTPPSEPAG